MTDLSDRLGRLSPERRRLLSARLRRSGLAAGADAPIPRRDRSGPVPASFAQERLWFLDQLGLAGAAYHVVPALHLVGPLDVAVLERSLREIVRRHEVLRTTLPGADGRPRQVVSGEVRLPFTVRDVSAVPAEGRDAAAEAVALEELARPFDLGRGPLIAALLLKLGEHSHVLFVAMHHVVSDGWSRRVLVREIGVLYDAFRRGDRSPLPDLPLQFADHALWQQQELASGALDREIAYWQERLADPPAALELPADRPRPAVTTGAGERLEMVFSRDLSDALREFSRRARVTLFMTLLGGFQALLGRLSGEIDILVGTPSAGRDRPELEGLIGCFVNTLVLRTDLGGDPTFAELVARVRETALGAFAHQAAPFARVVEAVRPDRSLRHAPLYQVSFDLQKPPAPALDRLDLGGLRLEAWRPDAGADLDPFLSFLDTRTAKFDLLLSMMDAEGGIMGVAEYSTDLFDRATIERLLGHFQTLLAGAASRPDTRLSELPLLGEAEHRQVVAGWNRTAHDQPFASVVERFEAEVARAPAAPAVTFAGATLSYAELNTRANRLAHRLRRLGLGPGRVAGVCLERSADLVPALLGVVKSGAAYLPLDPGHPPARTRQVLDEAGASVLICAGTSPDPPPSTTTRVLLLDSLQRDAAPEPADNPRPAASPDELAYVIYTSGSTGRPKGVQIGHAALANYLGWAARRYRLDAGPLTTLLHGSLGFDLTVTALWLPLVTGGAVQVAPPGDTLAALVETLRAAPPLDFLKLTPAHLEALANLLSAAELARLTPTLVIGGEQLYHSQLAPWFAANPALRAFNEYGPTEATVGCAVHLVDPTTAPPAPVPIGRPIDNARLYLLDRHMEPVPIGVRGEVYIAGAGLGRGYRQRPDLTAASWLPDPFSPEPGGRVYRTGDLARHRADGTIEFVGRIDQQVKVRGFRVELGEVEAVLRGHPGVRECVVTVTRWSPGDVRLVAYVVTGGVSPPGHDLEGYLRHRLPGYMVPSAFVPLERLPLAPSGKVDRAALPAPPPAQPAPGDAPAGDPTRGEPRGPLERQVARIWSAVLGVEPIRRDDDFFDLGGHSLLATQVVARVRRELGAELPVRALFEAPTVAGVARALAAASGGGAKPGAAAGPAAIHPVARDGRLELSFAQQRLWFLAELDPRDPTFNICWILRLRGALDAESLRRAVEEIVHRHEVLRTTVAVGDGRPYLRIAEPSWQPLPLQDLSPLSPADAEVELEGIVREEARTPFDLAHATPLRAQLVRLGEREHALLLTVHHIAFDGGSMAIFHRELAALYRACRAGEVSPLAPLPIQYADYAAGQRRSLGGAVLEELLDYWQRELRELPEIELSTDRLRPQQPSLRGASEEFVLPCEPSAALTSLSRSEGVTLFMTLLAGFAALLRHRCGADEVAIGTFVSHRPPGTEDLIGCFVNTLVLRVRLGGDPSFRQLLARVRATVLGAFAHQDLPFERLLEAVARDRDPGRTPLFQVVLSFADRSDPEAAVSLSGLEVELPEHASDIALFDLTLNLVAKADGLHGDLRYATDLFDAATARRMVATLGELLGAAAARPDARLSQLVATRALDGAR